MDFEALRREPDLSVKIYLSTQKQTRESRVRDLCTSIQSRPEAAAGRLRGMSFF